MVIIEDNFKNKLDCNTIIALGNFDGLHLGHTKLISTAVEIAKEKNIKSMVYTFKNHPLSVINKELSTRLLMSNETKVELLKKLNVDIVNFVTFSEEFMMINPEEFIKNLVDCYSIKGIVVGFNYRFGYKNMGTIELLKSLSEKYNYEVFVIEPVKIGDNVVSSTLIRNLISEGDLETANKLLPIPFMVEGKVKTGKHIGRKIGFPTANVDFDIDFLIPLKGVYYTYTYFEGNLLKSITNVGYNPTVKGDNLTIETHILNFDKQIYDEHIKVFFIKRIRDEIKFNSLQELIEQLKKDKDFAEKQSNFLKI